MALRRRPPGRPPADERETVVEGRRPPAGPPPGEADRYLWPWLALLLVVLAVGGGLAAYFATRGGGEHKVLVPQVVGLNEAAAVGKIRARGLDPNVSRVFSKKASGVVIAQDPDAGEKLARGRVVAVSVSKGPSAVAVPNLVSLTEADAVAQLTRIGLRADVVQVPSGQAAGKVVAQNPTAGEKIDPGSAVRLNVSRGRTQTTTVTTTTQTTPTTTQTTPTTTGTTTTTSQTTVPDVVDQVLSDAAASMKAASLLADSYPVNSQEPGGTVVGQNPAAGQTVDAGSVVRLNVSVGQKRALLPVPQVRGDEQAARQLLSRKFTVRALYRSGERGTVLDQSPDPGARIKRWAQVTIFVGR